MSSNILGNAPNIPGNIAKYSGKCHQTFRRMLPNVPGNVLKYSGECRQTLRGMSSNIPENIAKHSGECSQTFWGMSPNILGNVAQLLLLISECFTIHYVLINLNKGEYLYNFPASKNVLLANPKETF